METPPEDITPEILDEAEEHQFFFTGDIVGPATLHETGLAIHSYSTDQVDEAGLPIGQENQFHTQDTGSGILVVSLRHIPTEDGESLKTPGLAADLAEDGEEQLPGDWDIQVEFPLIIE